MSETNIVLLTWDNSSTAYEAFSKFRDLDSAAITIVASAVVERNDRGQLRVTDGQDNDLGLSTLGGGGIGALIGILGGPLGVLLGFATGALIGSTVDAERTFDADDALTVFSSALPAGRTGVIAEVEETDPAVLDDFAKSTGAELLRRPEDEVLDEVAAAEDAAIAAADAAREKAKEAKKAERKEKREERIAKIKAKL
ncbi:MULTISPECIES: DUF1269 domain-containing protein [Brevibacterium]|uniref:DUF1269 domain-containing protein n=4 Tax=Brevibacterium casei TaxID=33889 RepID=K9B1J8_9MICO|nr:DUF1269 domain-containing protein [Brevibacterium casei]NJE67179.1 DUF1269 domain-containing protein [Brevibacterium sp. LS14]SIH95328.1 Predicted membrane protein [Mycobacteroides abscessus subsp. abscessus]EKU48687.1 hypothetical protein C272_03980 [Brevibacterium casei S18]KZE22244.1 hypothetical protein AVW13_08150 [Brevibacterium casei]MBE4693352.1 DUF1269 domain-containing protein [Brevibacterium casei]